jgi:hypothetical protein
MDIEIIFGNLKTRSSFGLVRRRGGTRAFMDDRWPETSTDGLSCGCKPALAREQTAIKRVQFYSRWDL